jgi:acyl-coenzyme A thioesterase PaaI-like protein
VLSAEFKINLLRAARGDRLHCIGTVLKPGRRLIVSESEIYDGDPQEARLVAKATVTLAVMTKPLEDKSDSGSSPSHKQKE